MESSARGLRFSFRAWAGLIPSNPAYIKWWLLDRRYQFVTEPKRGRGNQSEANFKVTPAKSNRSNLIDHRVLRHFLNNFLHP